MLDIQQLRSNLDAVAEALAKRGKPIDFSEFKALEAERKTLQTRTQDLQAQRNSLSKQIGMLKGQGKDATGGMAQVGTLAEDRGLGTTNPARIRVVGQPVAQVGRRFEKYPADWGHAGANGHYGQGNHRWLLKGPLPPAADDAVVIDLKFLAFDHELAVFLTAGPGARARYVQQQIVVLVPLADAANV